MYNSQSLKAEFKPKGYKLTPQRELIFQVFQNLPVGTHLSVEEIHQLLVRRGEGINLSTVYRNLKIMRQIGILREVELAQPYKNYELNTNSKYHHHHVVCVQCHQTLEFENHFIIKQAAKHVQKAGLELIDCQLTLHAICPEAIEKGWPQSVPSHWVCPRAICYSNVSDIELCLG